jgi:hypothetical protein
MSMNILIRLNAVRYAVEVENLVHRSATLEMVEAKISSIIDDLGKLREYADDTANGEDYFTNDEMGNVLDEIAQDIGDIA